MKHIPVLLNSVIKALGDVRGRKIIDATFGAGGYSRAFLDAGAEVVAFDKDSNVISDAEDLRIRYKGRFSFVNKAFSNISELKEQVDAIVFDLGISSMQIDTPSRGFSFRWDGPLDMRMSESGETAADLIKNLSAQDLADVLRDYGDIKKATVLANKIKKANPETTFELKELINNPKDIAPVFQALRIAVNDEMGELETALDSVPDLLKTGGKCICVTFHSLEDRVVKNKFKKWTTVAGDPRLPVIAEAQFKLIKSETPGEKELSDNPRARSAHMRGVIKSY